MNLNRLRKPRRPGPVRGLAVLAPLLGGCVLDHNEPPFALPPTPAAFKAAASFPAPAVGEWPRQFGSAELVTLVRQAEAQNFDIAAAVARITQADAQARIAGSALFPQLEAGENAQRTLSPGTNRSKTPPFRSSVSNSFNLGLTASYMLDLFGRNRTLAKAAEIDAVAARYDRDVVSVATLASVANLYFELLGSQDRLRLARQNIRLAEHVLDAIRARLAVGTATALDTAQQESIVANQRAAVPALEQTIQQNRNLLAVLVGRTPESMNIRGGSLDRLKVPRVRPGLPSQLLLRRPDVASAETHLSSQNASVEAARLAFFPAITLTGNVGLASVTLQNLFRPEALAASLAEGLTQPIFTGGNLEGQLQAAKGRQVELLEDYRKTIVTALSDVENALVAVHQTSVHERLQRAAVTAAQRAYQITDARLREGTIDVITLLNTQQTLFQAQDVLSQVRLARFQALVSLYQALGGGWTDGDARLTIVADPSVPASLAPEARR